MLAQGHIAAMKALLANYQALIQLGNEAEEMLGANVLDNERALAELNAAMRLLTDGLTTEARAAIDRATSGASRLPFPVSIED